MRKLSLALLAGIAMLSGCVTYCPAYDSSYRYAPPLNKPTFKKDEGHQKNKYTEAAHRAAAQTEEELFAATIEKED